MHAFARQKPYWVYFENFSNDSQSCSHRQSLLHLQGAHHFESLQRIHGSVGNLAGGAGTIGSSISIYVGLCKCTQDMALPSC